MSTSNSNQSLLFAVIAFQMNFVTRDQFVAATSVWLLDRSKSMEEIFIQQGALNADDRNMLAPLVARHLEKHDRDIAASLAALQPSNRLTRILASFEDEYVENTLHLVSDYQTGVGAGSVDEPTLSHIATDGDKGSRYQILRSHAKGGLGEVFVAHDSELNREVALKEIRSGMDEVEELRNRFVLEAEITGGLEHPGIVPVYGLGKYEDGRPYYAMRFVRGDSLKVATRNFHKQADGKQKDYYGVVFRKLLGRFVDVCNAVEYAHSRGVVHRDLKPGNVMLGKYGETLVVDWGLAKIKGREDSQPTVADEVTLQQRSGGSGTLQGRALGTPAYMPPEQASGDLRNIGVRSDVYSLGATLYYMLTGKAPFGNDDLDEVLDQVKRGEVKPPHSVDPRIPKALSAICMKSMATAQADRYETPRQLVDEIERWLADEPVQVYKEPLHVRSARWIKRHKLLVSNLAAVLLIGLAALAVTSFILKSSNEALAKANLTIREKIKNVEKANSQTSAINDFLTEDLLSQADPERNPFREKTTVFELLARAAKKIDSNQGLAGEPEIEASIRHTIGNTYRALGASVEAETHLARAYDLRLKLLGAEAVETIDSLNALVKTLVLNEDLTSAEEYVERLLSTTKSLKLDESEILALKLKSEILQRQGRYEEAEEVAVRSLERAARELGDTSEMTQDCRANLAAILEITGKDFDRAKRLLETSVEMLRQQGAESSRELLTARVNLAALLGTYGQAEQAKEIMLDVVRQDELTLPLNHPTALNNRIGLAAVHSALGEFAPAALHLERALKLAESSVGPDHFVTWFAREELSAFYLMAATHVAPQARMLDEAVQLSTRNLETCKSRNWSVLHSDGLSTRFNLSRALFATGKARQAAKIVQDGFEKLMAERGPKSLKTIQMGIAYGNMESDADQIVQELLPLMDYAEKALPQTNSIRAFCASTLATALFEIGDLEKSKQYLRQFLFFCQNSGLSTDEDLENFVGVSSAILKKTETMEKVWKGKLEKGKHYLIEARIPGRLVGIEVSSFWNSRFLIRDVLEGRSSTLVSPASDTNSTFKLLPLDGKLDGLEYSFEVTEMELEDVKTVTAKLDDKLLDRVQKDFRCFVTEVQLDTTGHYEISVASKNFRPFVRLESETEKVIRSGNAKRNAGDSNGRNSGRVAFRLLNRDASKTVRVVVLGNRKADAGEFVLSVKKAVPQQAVVGVKGKLKDGKD